jgi:hypothetical protein
VTRVVAVALDHRRAFAESNFPIVARLGEVATKAWVATTMQAPVDAYVLDDATVFNLRHEPSWGDIRKRVWLGDRDYTRRTGEDAEAGEAMVSAITVAGEAGLRGIKFGIEVPMDPEARVHAVAFVKKYGRLGRAHDLGLITEPYFNALPEIARRAFLASTSAYCDYFKCDLDEPKRGSMSYTDAARKPWLARSDGLEFEDFVNRLALAYAHGCAGAIVGRALWKDALSLEEPEAIMTVLEERMKRLRVLDRT